MASTNKTTHYDLSQYIATDKPTYLVDYNGDMTKIDSAIYETDSLSKVNESAIGTLSNLDTTVKSDLVSAINEVNTQVGLNTTAIGNNTTAIGNNTRAIGTLANLDTIDKSDLVDAINEIVSQFNIGNPVTYDNSINPYTCDNGTVSYGNFTLVSNPMGSMAKIYGAVVHTPSTTNSSEITIGNSSLRPSTDIIINNAGLGISFSESATYIADLKIKTNGDIVLLIPGRPLNSLYFVFQPFVYFIKDFGDTNQ